MVVDKYTSSLSKEEKKKIRAANKEKMTRINKELKAKRYEKNQLEKYLQKLSDKELENKVRGWENFLSSCEDIERRKKAEIKLKKMKAELIRRNNSK